MNNYAVILTVFLIPMLVLSAFAEQKTAGTDSERSTAQQQTMPLDEYLDKSGEEWFLTGKKDYAVQAMMVSKETSFHNEPEAADYTVSDDGMTIVLRGTAGEMWASKLPQVISSYTKPDGSEISKSDFEKKDTFIDLITKPRPDMNFAMHVPCDISVIVETVWGDILHTNLPDVPHGNRDYLICRKGDDGEPDLSDVWVLNGILFPETYDTTNIPKNGETASD